MEDKEQLYPKEGEFEIRIRTRQGDQIIEQKAIFSPPNSVDFGANPEIQAKLEADYLVSKFFRHLLDNAIGRF